MHKQSQQQLEQFYMTQFPAIFDRSNIEQHKPPTNFSQTKHTFGHRSRSIQQPPPLNQKSLLSTTQMSPHMTDRKAFNQLSDHDFTSPFLRTKHNFSQAMHKVAISPSALDIQTLRSTVRV